MGAYELPFVSVIIPTYRDWERLRFCLEALLNQTYPHEKFEVIIVNNDPDDEPPYEFNQKNFYLLNELKPGSYAARNTGIRSAKGKVYAFTDSDCIPHLNWIENATGEIRDGATRVAGKIELFYQSSGSSLTISELCEKAFAFNQFRHSLKGVSVTANMITTSSVFKDVGLFDESLCSGGDIEWGLRACKLGIDIIYSPEVVVKHPARHEFSQLISKYKRVAKGSARFRKFCKRRDLYLYIFRGFMPPISVLGDLINRDDLNLNEKVLAWLVLYYLKVFSKVEFLKTRLELMDKIEP